MKSFLFATAWKTDPVPKPYGAFHLAFFAGSLVVAFALAFVLRKLSGKKKDRVLFAVGIALAVTELYKQLFLYYVAGQGSYDWWYFPFQLCSVPMYLCPAVPFLKNGRAKNAVCTFLSTYSLLGGVMAFAEPSGLLHPYWTWTVQAFLWHSLLIFLGLFVWFSGLPDFSRRGFADASLLFFACAAVAEALNVGLHGASGGTINMFYISPYFPSEQIVFHELSLALGILPGIVIYLLCICLGAFLLFLLERNIRPRR